MDLLDLKTMKEVVEMVKRPAHRIIHLCEMGLVRPWENPAGRGKVRRFRRDDIFFVALALELQDTGIALSTIAPLVDALKEFLKNEQIPFPPTENFSDLIGALTHLGNAKTPVLGCLLPASRVALITPLFMPFKSCDPQVMVHRSIEKVLGDDVIIVANLTRIAKNLGF
jgi:DNA-binding transcriptional MerR regulator